MSKKRKQGRKQGRKISGQIDNAWNMLSLSKEKSLDEFMNIYSKYDDDKSLYIIGFIYDDYLKDIDNTLLYYNMYLEKFPDGGYSSKVLDRITELKDMFEYKLKFINQKLNYRKGIRFFKNNFQIDSSIHYLNLASVGIDRDLKSYCNNISESIKLYSKNDSLYKMNYSNLDSVKINLANILYFSVIILIYIFKFTIYKIIFFSFFMIKFFRNFSKKKFSTKWKN